MMLSLPTSPSRRRALILWALIFALLMIRYVAFGLRYWPQMDDYIQYLNYSRSMSFPVLCQVVGLLSARPLAGIADYFVWAPLWPVMIVGVALVSGLYAACVVLMGKLAARYVPVGPVFPVVMALLPLGMEGLYWMSASTRVVGGLFFACLGAWLFARWLDTGKWYWAAACMPVLLLPFGFYEQSGVLSVTLVMGMGLLECRKRPRRALLALWSPAAMVLYFAFLRLMSSAYPYASRSQLMLPKPGSTYYWDTFLPQVLEQIRRAFPEAGWYTLVRGLPRGWAMIVENGLWLWLAVTAALCLGFWRLWTVSRPDPVGETRWQGTAPVSRLILALFLGLILTAAPLTPFFVLDNPWFSLRSTVTSFAGVALVADALAGLVFRGTLRRGLPVLAACAALVCSVASLSETADYRATYFADQRVAGIVADGLERENVAPGQRVGILNIQATYLPEQNYYYHGHIQGCTQSDWSFTGLLTAITGRVLPTVTPLPNEPMYQNWNCEVNRPDTFDLLFYFDGEDILPVTLEDLEEHCFRVWTEDGRLAGTVIEEENRDGYFVPAL